MARKTKYGSRTRKVPGSNLEFWRTLTPTNLLPALISVQKDLGSIPASADFGMSHCLSRALPGCPSPVDRPISCLGIGLVVVLPAPLPCAPGLTLRHEGEVQHGGTGRRRSPRCPGTARRRKSLFRTLHVRLQAGPALQTAPGHRKALVWPAGRRWRRNVL